VPRNGLAKGLMAEAWRPEKVERMRFTVESYAKRPFDGWNAFIREANGGTLFHRLDFLAYHGARFRAAEHHLVIYKGESVHGVMPMAVFEEEHGRVARSPYGGSYGGPVFREPQRYQESLEILGALADHLSECDVSEIAVTLPISICYRRYSETLRLAMLERGFECVRRDVSSVVPLFSGETWSSGVTSRARNMARKAMKEGVQTVSRGPLRDFGQVMEATFEKHGVSPTHTLSELEWLQGKFRDSVYVDLAYLDGTPVAGICFFVLNGQANSSFYLCQDPRFQKTQALSLLICEALERCRQEGFRWFDFGTSSVDMRGRAGIFRFKESFGAIGAFRETYAWSLRDAGGEG